MHAECDGGGNQFQSAIYLRKMALRNLLWIKLGVSDRTFDLASDRNHFADIRENIDWLGFE
jgi:hypothetical protein